MHPNLLELEASFTESPLIQIHDEFLDQYAIELWFKRDDLLHPVISGNKWRKLKYALEHALSVNCDTLISMGGAYSNHLHALAFAGKYLGLKTKGFIRGELMNPINPTLQDLENWGMKLDFIAREDYRSLRQYQTWESLPNLPTGHYWLPEGGAGKYALQGVGEIIDELTIEYDYLCVACGTGTTLAGLLNRNLNKTKLLGFAALKNANFLYDDIKKLLQEPTPNTWAINLDYHFGGFGKVPHLLAAFIERFEHISGVPLEPIYTGKMVYGIYDLIKNGFFKPGNRIIVIHSGGLQGNRDLSFRN